MTAKELLTLYVAKYMSDGTHRNRDLYVKDSIPPGYREAYERGYADDVYEDMNSTYLRDQFEGLEDF